MKTKNEFLELFNERKFAVLDYLVDQEGEVTVSDIKRATNMTRLTIITQLGALSQYGVVQAVESKGDFTVKLCDTSEIVRAFKELNNAFLKHQEKKTIEE